MPGEGEVLPAWRGRACLAVVPIIIRIRMEAMPCHRRIVIDRKVSPGVGRRILHTGDAEPALASRGITEAREGSSRLVDERQEGGKTVITTQGVKIEQLLGERGMGIKARDINQAQKRTSRLPGRKDETIGIIAVARVALDGMAVRRGMIDNGRHLNLVVAVIMM